MESMQWQSSLGLRPRCGFGFEVCRSHVLCLIRTCCCFTSLLDVVAVVMQSLAYAKQEELRGQLKADGHNAGIGFTTARYNDPSVQAIFRRNEVLVPLEGFKLLEPEQ